MNGMDNIYKKLLEVKKDIPYIQKDKKSPMGYTYASQTKVLIEINKLLNKVGVILKSEVVDVRNESIIKSTKSGDKKAILYNVKMLMTWVNTENPNEFDTNQWWGTGCNGEEKGFGSALTYGERYFMLKYFNIPTDDIDPDSFGDIITDVERKEMIVFIGKATDAEGLLMVYESMTKTMQNLPEIQTALKTRKTELKIK